MFHTPIVILAACAIGEAPAQPDAAELVAKLGRPSFAVRQRAMNRLAKMGESAIEALRAGAESGNPEIRDRSQRLLRIIENADLARLRAAFLAGDDDAAAAVSVAWAAYRKELGGGDDARKFFWELWRTEPRFLLALEADADEARSLLESTAEGLTKSSEVRNLPEYPLFLVAAMAVLTIAEDDLPRQARYQFARVVQSAGYRDDLPGDPMFRKLLGRWVLQQTDQTMSNYGVRIARQYGFPEGVTLSRIVLRQSGSSHSKAEAILTLGQNGEAKDVKLIEPLLKDATRLGGFRVNGQPWVYHHVRDVALGVSIILSGEDPQAYGFEHLSRGEHLFNNTSSFGFDSDDKRAEAFDKWRKRTSPGDGT